LQAIADQANDRAAFLRLAENLTAFLARLHGTADTLSVMEWQRIVRLVVKDVMIGDDTITIRHSISVSQQAPPQAGNLPPCRTEGRDYLIYVRSECVGQRVMMSITRFIARRLKLKVNETKSAVARPQERKFLGFSFTNGPEIRRAIAPKALMRFKDKIREITRQAKGISIETTVKPLATYMVGWRGYFGFCETPEVLIGLVRWVRLGLRCALWRHSTVHGKPFWRTMAEGSR